MEKAVVSPPLYVAECISRISPFAVGDSPVSSPSTQEKEKVQTWDRRSSRDQKVPTEHGSSHSKAPVFTTRTHFNRHPRLQRSDSQSAFPGFRDRFVGSRSRAGHDDRSKRLHRSRITVAEFGHPRSSGGGGSLSCSLVRRRVSSPQQSPLAKTASNRTTPDGIYPGTFAQSMQSASPSCNAIFNWLGEYVGHGGACDRTLPRYLYFPTSHIPIFRDVVCLLCLFFLFYVSTPFPDCDTRSHPNTIFTTFWHQAIHEAQKL